MIRAAALFILTAIVGGPCPGGQEGTADRAAEDPALLCIVASITDGDTLRCEGGRRVRLLLIDSPEMNQGPFGAAARDALLDLAPPGTRLVMEFDLEQQDRYSRTLAYLYDAEGRMLNEEMARSGFAVAISYPPNVRHLDRIRAAVDEARAARAGLWSTPAFECLPVDHRAGRCIGR